MAQPVASFTADVTSGCSPLTVRFTNTSTGNPTNSLWRLGNGNTSIITNPSAIYVTPGLYTVTLVVSNANGVDSVVKTNYIRVFNLPTANFTHNINSGCAPLNVQFTNTSTVGSAPINKYLWDFGDGNLDSIASPLHTYNSSGVKTVTLTVTDTNGCQHSFIKPSAITVTQTHTINFSANNTFACNPPLLATFSPTVTPAGSYTYQWTTSNGFNVAGQNPQINFTTSGKFSVTLKVTNNIGCSETITKTAYIQVNQTQADYTYPILCENTFLNLTNTSIPDSANSKYYWYINNLIEDSTKNLLQKNIAKPSTNVKLLIVSGICKDSIVKTIQFNPKPVTKFTALPTAFCKVPALITFTNQSTQNPGVQYQWIFGNTQTANTYNASTTYINPATYNPKLVVTDATGCTGRDSIFVEYDPILAKIKNQNAKQGCIPLNEIFELDPDGQSGTIDSMEWWYNGVLVSKDKTYNRQFPDTGVFVVKLVLKNRYGCVLELYDTVKAGMKIPVRFTVDKRMGCYSTISPVKGTGYSKFNIEPVTYVWSLIDYFTDNDDTKIDRTIGGKDGELFFGDTGWYGVKFHVSHYGCITDSTADYHINVFPSKAMYDKPTIACGNDSILFENQSSGKNKYWWTFGDGDSSTLFKPKHYFDSSGTYKVTLIAYDTTFGCYDTFSRNIVIPVKPILDFSISDSTGCLPHSVMLTNLTVVPQGGYPIGIAKWTVSDGTTITQNNPTIKINATGYFSVKMSVLDVRNCWFHLTKDSLIRVYNIDAGMQIIADNNCIPFQFKAVNKTTSDAPLVNKWWVIGKLDSMSTTNDTLSYTINNPSELKQSNGYRIKLTVTDSVGCIDTISRIVKPTIPLNKLDLARVITCGAQTFNFSTQTTPDLVCPPATYSWKLEGATFNGPTFSRNFTALDSVFNLKLTITDSNLCQVQHDTVLTVSNHKPQVGFYANPPKLDCYKPVKPISLVDTSIAGATPIKTWDWTTGPNKSNKQFPDLTFSKPGKYGVKLRIVDSVGCVDSISIPDYIVIGGPTGTFNVTPLAGCRPHNVSYVASSPNAKYYIWDMADGFVDTFETLNFNYQYTLPGIYYPGVTLVDSSGTCDFGYDSLVAIVVHDLPKPDFVSDLDVICINSTVTFTNATPNSADINKWYWQINDADSFNSSGPWVKTFTKPGSYQLKLIVQDLRGCIDSIIKPDFITVLNDTTPPSVPSVFRATVIDNQSAEFNFTSNHEIDFDRYRVYYNFNNGLAQNFANIDADLDTGYTQNFINTLQNQYSYAVAAIDVCNNISDTSEIHTTVEVKAKPEINAIQINWLPYTGFDTINRYEIWRNNPDSGNTFVFIKSVSADTLSYIDTNVTCFNPYFYKIKTVEYNGLKQFSWSDTAGAVPIYVPTLPDTETLRATVEKNKVRVEWKKRTHEIKFKYVLYRQRDDEASSSIIGELTDTFFVDALVDVQNHSYTYTTYLKDVCGGLSAPSNIAKTILLKVELQENDVLKFDPQLNFTHYKQWQNGVDWYEVRFLYDSTGEFETVKSLPPTDTSFFHEYLYLKQFDYCYKITAFELNGNQQQSESNEACVDTKPRLYAPNAFTINNDGINDYFVLGGIFLESYHLIIYDRWGKLVFESFDIHNSWDGTQNGIDLPADVYVYVATGTGRHGQVISINGNVTLIR